MTSELHLKLFELLQPALSQDKAREVVFTLEKTIENQIANHPGLDAKEDIKELSKRVEDLSKRMEDNFNRVNDRIEKLIYFVIGQFIALVGFMFAIARFMA